MKLSEIRGFSRLSNKAFRGKKNNIVVYVNWLDALGCWYFSVIHPGGNRYNSLWDEIRFNDFDECKKNAESYCDKYSQGGR